MGVTRSNAVEPPLTIRLFGPFEVRVNGSLLPRLRSYKERWLLALLTLRRGDGVERSWLAGALWPDSTGSQALATLRRSLTDLRRAMGPEGRRLLSPTRRLVTFDLVGAAVDLLEFDAALARGDAPSLETAVALYRGSLLEGCAEEWILDERQAREEAYLSALERLAAEALARGEPAKAAGYLRRAAALDPLRESAQCALMQALAAGGSYAASAELYRELRLRLYRELNTEPAAETTALYQQIRAAARRRATEGERERGREGESVGGAMPEPHRPSLTLSLAPSLTPSLTPSSAASRLPRPLTPLVGREHALREVVGYLATTRLVTLTGTGGIGKTRLAIHAAEAAAGDYADGVCFVELAALTDPTLVPQAVASALELREQPDRPLTATLQDFLRARQLLLVLDNCEHLIDACAQLADALLRGCVHLRILATSRQSLGLTGEVTWRVPSLTLPEEPGVRRQASGASKDPERQTVSDSSDWRLAPDAWRLMQSEAVRLFVERAAAVAPGFTLTEGNAAAVAQVCCRLDGIPLALELAAARAKALPVEQIPALLDQPFRLLTGGSRAALPRHQTLRAAIDWSYDLLSAMERVLLRRLAVFAGGFTLEAAEAVCSEEGVGRWALGGRSDDRPPLTGAKPPSKAQGLTPDAQRLTPDEVLDVLTALVDKSLVVYEEQEGEARYRLLETIRGYGWDRLVEAGETEIVRGRHRDWYLQLAERAAPELYQHEQARWFERLEREHDNLRAALSGAVACGEVEVALRLGGALQWFWGARGYSFEGRKRLTELLALPGVELPTAPRARVLQWAGQLADSQGDHEAARMLLEESVTIQRALDDKERIARSLRPLAQNAVHRGDYATARTLFEESLAIQQALGDRQEVAALLMFLGDVVLTQGDDETARALCTESLALSRELGNKNPIAWSLQGLGQVARAQGDTATARALLEESVALLKESGIRPGTAQVLRALGDVVKDQGDLTKARDLYGESLAIGRAVGHKRIIAASLGGLGSVAAAEGYLPAACSFYHENLRISHEMRDNRGVASCLEGLANVAARQGGKERAARLFAAAEALRQASGAPLSPHERAEYERQVAAVRAELGAEAFAAAWAEGRALTLEAAVQEAMRDG